MTTKIEEILKKINLDNDANRLVSLAKQLSKIPKEEFEKEGFIFKKLAVLSNYTSQFLAQLISLYAASQKVHLTLFESEYGLAESIIYSKDEELKEFKPDICYFCVGTDQLSFNAEKSEPERWKNLWKQAHDWLGCEIIQNTFEEPIYQVYGNFEPKYRNSMSNFVRSLNKMLAEDAPSYVHFCDVNYLASYYGRKNWRDEKLFDQSKMPVNFDLMPEYAKAVASVISSNYGKTKKCLVLDLDNTLWGGVIGDDGLSKIKIGNDSEVGEAYLRLQKYIKELKNRGVILAVCSKNDPANAKEPFLKRSDMVLKLEDISCFVANWDPKHINIVKISKELEIGLDSLVFLDDNPAEREIIKQNLPQVSIIELSDDPYTYQRSLAECNYFDLVRLTDEDLKKTEQYRANSQRQELQSNFVDYNEFLVSLKMAAVVAPFDTSNLPRITQLINKTNQFNLTTKRYNENDIEKVMHNPNAVSRYIKVRDQFGDNGLISVFFGFLDDSKVFTVDTWVMSCRVLKRSIEALIIKDVVKNLLGRKACLIRGQFIPTAKNSLVENLYADLGFQLEKKEDNKTTTWTLDLTDKGVVEKVMSRETPISLRSESEYLK